MNEQIDPANVNSACPLLEVSIPVDCIRDSRKSSILNLKIHKRHVVWLLGRSGIGKTTILRTIARLHEQSGVKMKFQGHSSDHIEARRWRRSILYVNQKPVMFRGSVQENIFKPFGLRLNKNRIPENRAVITLLKKFCLSESILGRDAMTLSVGEAARICLVRSLLLTPDILLLDEPTASLDLDSRKAVANALNEWLSFTDGAIIGVTHDETLTKMVSGTEIHLGISGGIPVDPKIISNMKACD